MRACVLLILLAAVSANAGGGLAVFESGVSSSAAPHHVVRAETASLKGGDVSANPLSALEVENFFGKASPGEALHGRDPFGNGLSLEELRGGEFKATGRPEALAHLAASLPGHEVIIGPRSKWDAFKTFGVYDSGAQEALIRQRRSCDHDCHKKKALHLRVRAAKNTCFWDKFARPFEWFGCGLAETVAHVPDESPCGHWRRSGSKPWSCVKAEKLEAEYRQRYGK